MNKKISIGIVVVVVALFTIGIVTSITPATKNSIVVEQNALEQPVNDNGANVKYRGQVQVWKTEATTGDKTLVADKHNLLVNNGISYIIHQIGSGASDASNATLAISLSDAGNAPAAGWTVIPQEISNSNNTNLSRHLGTYTANGTTGYNVTYTWTASATHNNVELTGLSFTNVSNANTLFAALQFTNQSLLVNDQLQVIWQITIG